MIIKRDLTKQIERLLKVYPVVSLTGPRQSGKSTLAKNEFSDYNYISFEEGDIRQIAIDDPRGFLNNYGDKLIIDEAQYVPELFSYIQSKVDSSGKNGMYILSGSQNFLMMKSVSQSLAGRVGITTLLPFSYGELKRAGQEKDLSGMLYTGGYPRIYQNPNMNPTEFYEDYLRTYVERDIQALVNVHNLAKFRTFVELCAARTGQLLNISSLANDAKISVETANSWLSILETSYVIYLLHPYYKNVGKRLIKSPKLYFYDTGLLAALLKIDSADKVKTSPHYGWLFENFVISEIIKSHFNNRKTPQLFFWRDSNGNEVDLLDNTDGEMVLTEIKASETMKKDFTTVVNELADVLGAKGRRVAYAGREKVEINSVQFLPWFDL
ncbi:ATP-binding protein [Candidatus Saccharibacteria bacterium]|nr:ATP-binding protein [Candidatus Saccharibacteria bacterium]